MITTLGVDRQSGQVLMMFALVLALLLSGLVALVGDVILLYDAAGRYDNGALVGAQAGASQVDPAALRNGVVQLDEARAAAVCTDAAMVTAGLERGDVTCTVAVDRRSIVARVGRRIPLMFSSFGPSVAVTRSHVGVIGIGESTGTPP